MKSEEWGVENVIMESLVAFHCSLFIIHFSL